MGLGLLKDHFHISTTMPSIKESGMRTQIKDMVSVLKYGLMDQCIKDIGKMIKLMVTED